jgi:hypothetical protein
MARKTLDPDYWQELCIAIVVTLIMGVTLYIQWTSILYVPVEKEEKCVKDQFGRGCEQ